MNRLHESFAQSLTRRLRRARTRFISIGSLFFTQTGHVPFRGNISLSFPLPRTSGGECHRRVRVRVRTESGPVVGSSGFRMNKHCLNRDSGSPGARCAPRPLLPAPCIISRSFRSEIRDFTSAYYAWRTARRVRWPFSKVVVPFYVRDSLCFVDRP